MTPTTMPSLMLPVMVIINMMSTEGMASTGLLRLICLMAENMWKLTINMIAPVTTPGIARKIGEAKMASMKQMAVVNDVMPVRPPSATPAALSK